MRTHEKPKNDAQAAALARARQLTDFKWIPLREVPTYTRDRGQTVLPAGVEVTGFPYASTELTDKFFTENVSFESFLTAIPNPDSKLYQPGWGAMFACNYGVVCNGLVRYALGIRPRVSTARWYTIPGMRQVAPRGGYRVEDMRLLDVLYAFGEGRNHVALITDIIREEGIVVGVEVSEAVRPSCRRAVFTPEEFYEKYALFGLCRYDLLDQVPPLDKEQDALLWKSGLQYNRPKIAVDNGNRSNYLAGETVLISVFGDGSDTLDLMRNGEVIKSLRVDARAMIPMEPQPGYYTASLRQAGESVEFAVNRANIIHTLRDGEITIHADPQDPESRILYADFRVKGERVAALARYEELTDEERETGCFTRPIPPDGENYKVYFENKYGVWTHPMTKIE